MSVEYCNELVCFFICVSVGKHISETIYLNFTKFYVHVACGFGSPLLALL